MQNIFFSRQNNNQFNRQTITANATNQDLQNITSDISYMLNYVNQLNQHIFEASNQQIKTMLTNIRNSIQVHIGELMSLLFSLDPNFYEQFQLGLEQGDSIIKRNIN